jgi:outer membrane protein assembly factor BamB
MKAERITLAALSACALFAIVTPASAQDWPQWRGPNRDGKASFNAPKTWPAELKKKWQTTVGSGAASPALVGGKLYVFARQEGSEVLQCLDAATGKELWQDKYDALPATGPAGQHPGPRSSPTIANGKVVTLGVRGTLSCLDATSGKVIWRKDDFKGFWPTFFTGSSPLVIDGLCVAQLGGKENGDRNGKDDGALIAYDLNSGEQKWKLTGDGPGYSSPVLITVGGTKLVVAQSDRKIMAVDAADGKLAWEAPFAPQGMGYNAATTIVDGSTIIFAGSGRGAKAVKIEKSGNGFTAKELWTNPDNSVQFNTPVLKNGLLFGMTAGNDFFCLNASDGKTAWTAPSGGQAAPPPGGGGKGKGGGGRGFGSIVDAGSVLLALTPSSELVVFQPSGKEFAKVAAIKVADKPTYATPVVSGNRIFVKDQETVALLTVE